jgi:hypothetical protein
MRKLVAHVSTSDCDHPATGLVVGTEIMLFGLAFNHFLKELAKLLIGCACAHGPLDIEFEMAAETGSQFTLASESQLVTALAKVQIGHRSDEPNALV